jgi:pentatricopeptide repeat protein
MFAKCGNLDQARLISFSFFFLFFFLLDISSFLLGLFCKFDSCYIFEQVKPQLQSNNRPVITYTAMIQAYKLHEKFDNAWELFQRSISLF